MHLQGLSGKSPPFSYQILKCIIWQCNVAFAEIPKTTILELNRYFNVCLSGGILLMASSLAS